MLQRWLIMGVAAAGISLALAGGYAWAERPETYRDAVVEALDQRHIAHSGLEVREVCRPDPNCIVDLRTFATVVVYRDSASYGQLTCYDRGGDCYLDIASLGIWRAPLRDLRGVRLLPKPLARLFERGAAWLRGWAGRAYSIPAGQPPQL